MRTTIKGVGLVVVVGVAVALLLFANGCGGGGGGERFAPEDLDGDWYGPTGQSDATGTAIANTGAGGMTADFQGGLELRKSTGTPVAATAVLVDSYNGIWSVTDTANEKSLLVMSPDKNHVLYVDQNFEIGAWERGASSFQPSYPLLSISDSQWIGTALGVSANYDPEAVVPVVYSGIDGTGTFAQQTADGTLSRTSTGPLVPILGAMNGQYEGDFLVEGGGFGGEVLALVTPDLQALVVLFCPTGAAVLQDCRLALWQR